MANETHAQKMLRLIEARLEGRLLSEHNEYSIAGRSMKLMSVPELIAARSKYLVEAKREETAQSGGRRDRIFARL
ncbi:MAG: hypothetical protein FWC38_00760 [Proteobacteria bacterium]|nr:hypothetical protein [Pseudomonadota bacterium]MCL2306773.1 hypothetical protein [Pseudomonadota bacterium]